MSTSKGEPTVRFANEPILRFTGEYRWLSNFWSCFVELDGKTYPSTENAFQAAKTLDTALRAPFRRYFPGKAKKEGRLLKLRPDWESVKLGIMEDLNRQKFTRNAELRERLLATGDAQLVEGNDWGDQYWGVDDERGGQNHLGKILMRIRAELGGKS